MFDDATYFSSLPSIFNVDESSPEITEFGFSNNNQSLPPILDAEGGFSPSVSVFAAGETSAPSLYAKSFQLENGFAVNYTNNNVSLFPSDAPLSVFGTAGETSMSAGARSIHLEK